MIKTARNKSNLMVKIYIPMAQILFEETITAEHFH